MKKFPKCSAKSSSDRPYGNGFSTFNSVSSAISLCKCFEFLLNLVISFHVYIILDVLRILVYLFDVPYMNAIDGLVYTCTIPFPYFELIF